MPAGQLPLDGKVVGVGWDDAHFNSSEVGAEDIVHRPWKYVTVGILVKSDEEGVTVAQDQGEDYSTRGRTFVPRRMILAEWDIGPVKPKVKRTRKAQPVNDESPATS